ncbi:phosphatidate cytidylyltransferase [Candidatus Babeliales bacterium]|nr:phosphatidate cytidylyltransferase [Candidatus Babeliales bacterium]
MKSFVQRSLTGIAFGVALLLFFIFPRPLIFSLLLFTLFIVIVGWELPYLKRYQNLATIYTTLGFITIIALNRTDYRPLIVYLFLLVFTFDVSAYITGTLIGHYKLVPRLSPKKTWEGLIGAIIITTTLFVLLTHHEALFIRIGYGLMLCATAFLGDLFVSWLKRKNNIKDTGSLLPGHGGLLDRFDSVLLTAFTFYVLRNELARLLL